MIKAPGWCPKAVPTLRGWKHHKTPEILKPAKITQAQIDEYMGVTAAPVIEEVKMPQEPVMLTEAPTTKSLDEMSKLELEEVGRQHGIELDRRKTKKTLIDRVKNLIE